MICRKFSLTLSFLLLVSLISSNLYAQSKNQAQTLDIDPDLAQLVHTPFAQADAQKLIDLPSDPEPEALIRNSHYWVSNEHNHQVWYPYLKEIKGALVGVGPDQNYLLAGWMKADVIVLMDFDTAVAQLHEIYHCFFKISATPENFLKRWSPQYMEDSKDKIEKCADLISRLDDAQKKQNWAKERIKIFNFSRALVYGRLLKTKKKYQELKIDTFLDDQTQYDHIRSLWQSKRAISVRGDLTANLTMKAIASTLKDLNVDLNLLYFSNAEQYFDYLPQFRRNILNFKFGEKGYVVRTLGWGFHKYIDEKEQYHYNIQSGSNFQSWMTLGLAKNAGKMLHAKKMSAILGFSEIVDLPPESKKKPKIADE
jgi:hypothetical protein